MNFSERKLAMVAKAITLMISLDLRIGSEEDYKIDAMRKIAQNNVLICKNCNRATPFTTNGERSKLCIHCQKPVWVTADTMYKRARLFRPRAIIIHWKENGVIISANQAAKLLKVSNHLVNMIFKQIGIMIQSQIPENASEIETSEFIEIVSRRTLKTPADVPPADEENAVLREDESATKDRVIDASHNLSDNEKKVLEVLSEKAQHFDVLFEQTQLSVSDLSSTLMLLELRGWLDVLTGDKFALKKKVVACNRVQDADKEGFTTTDFIYYIKDFFQGIGRKYLQPYASLRWISIDRERWPNNSLANLFASFPHISYDEILAYDTAPTIKLVRPAMAQ